MCASLHGVCAVCLCMIHNVCACVLRVCSVGKNHGTVTNEHGGDQPTRRKEKETAISPQLDLPAHAAAPRSLKTSPKSGLARKGRSRQGQGQHDYTIAGSRSPLSWRPIFS